LSRQFDSLEDMIGALRAAGVGTVFLATKVATAVTPGGDQIAFRGRVVVSAELPDGPAEYVEQVMPYITGAKSPNLSASPERAADLRAAQLALARQLRSYRGEYRGVVASARTRLTTLLAEAGLTVAEPDD
jgi:hypothetical protein